MKVWNDPNLPRGLVMTEYGPAEELRTVPVARKVIPFPTPPVADIRPEDIPLVIRDVECFDFGGEEDEVIDFRFWIPAVVFGLVAWVFLYQCLVWAGAI